MRVAVDTSVLLDVLAGDPTFGAASREALRRAYDSGSLVACDVVWAEVRANFAAEEDFERAMETLGVEFSPMNSAAAAMAGDLWRGYHRGRPRRVAGGGRRSEKRVVADFLVGAHAQLQADALLGRDRGFFRSCFRRLRLMEPSGSAG